MDNASTSNMLEKRSGVAIQIYKEQPKAYYTHYQCHSLNLSTNGLTDLIWTFSSLFGRFTDKDF